MRLFVALDLDQTIRTHISAYIDTLQPLFPAIKWTKPQSWHVTLKFIGETMSRDQISTALATIRSLSFRFSVKDLGFFSDSAPRIFYACIEDVPALSRLANLIESALVPLGIAKEEHPFSPHITLARSGSGRPRGGAEHRCKPDMRLLQQHVKPQSNLQPATHFGTMTAREFFLFQSETLPEGSRYTKLAAFRLT